MRLMQYYTLRSMQFDAFFLPSVENGIAAKAASIKDCLPQ
jgi:hypothetical protein